jgi:hypothetical protein
MITLKKLSLMLFVSVGLSASTCFAQEAPVFPYILTGSGVTCQPQTNCLNYSFIPQGWYGQVSEAASAQCYKLDPWAVGWQLNMYQTVSQLCVQFPTLIQAYFASSSAWNYAPGNPFATNNVIWAYQLVGVGTIYKDVNNTWYNIGAHYEYEDCYTGNYSEQGSKGGTC